MAPRSYLVPLAVVALAACGTGPTAAATPSAPATPAAAPTAAAAARTTPPCTGATTKVTVTKVTSPANHWLITARNTGRTTCNAYSAPFLGFENDQSTFRIVEESVPQAVLTLKPGQSAYAGLTPSSPGGTNGRTGHRLSIHFAARDSDAGSVGPAAFRTFRPGLHTDDTAQVTYWQSSPTQALAW